jgi:hypothetical protein
MNERIDAIYQQVIDEACANPLYRFAELVRQDEREKWNPSDMAHRSGGLTVDVTDLIERAKAEEREACAKLCDEHAKESWDQEGGALNCADKIRGRTEPKSDFKNQMDDNWSGII